MKLLSKFLPLLMLCCAGCVLSYSVSDHKEYRPYIGHAVTLTRPLYLVGVHSSLFSSGGVKTLGYARYGLAEPHAAWAPGPLYAKLPQGYPATIDSVHEEITGDEAVPVVYGHIVNPTTGERASFAYPYYLYYLYNSVHVPSPLPWQLAASDR